MVGIEKILLVPCALCPQSASIPVGKKDKLIEQSNF